MNLKNHKSVARTVLAVALAISSYGYATRAQSQTKEISKNDANFEINTDTQQYVKSSTKGSHRGVASWYGGSGGGYTAAHKTLPFGSKVRVTNLRNGRSVVVKINDRGPFVRGRVIDLSPRAAQAIGIYGSGLGNVQVEVLGGG